MSDQKLISFSDMGILLVELLDGKDLAAADRGGNTWCHLISDYDANSATSGKSDPYAVFSLNDNKVHKSQTKKKTLNPEWQENFVVNVVRRSHITLLFSPHISNRFSRPVLQRTSRSRCSTGIKLDVRTLLEKPPSTSPTWSHSKLPNNVFFSTLPSLAKREPCESGCSSSPRSLPGAGRRPPHSLLQGEQ